MKLTIGLAAALAGCAAAAQNAADVFILRESSSSSSTTPSAITPSIARLLLLQRLAPAGKGPSVHDIGDDVDLAQVVSVMNQFGPTAVPLFDKIAGTPSQLLVMLEGLTDAQMEEVAQTLQTQPAITITDPPSSRAHEQLVANDFYNVGVTKEHGCSIAEVSNPFEERCWSGSSTVAKFNVEKNPEALVELTRSAADLIKLADSGEMETTVILFPDAAGKSQPNKWSETQELRRRQSELVISALDEEESPVESAAPTSVAESDETIFYVSTNKKKEGAVPACFDTEEACIDATGNCSEHGKCRNKYAKRDGSSGKSACFSCHCMSTSSENSSYTHWAGKTCARKDVSVPFWLFAGFTLAMVGIVTVSIGMLYSIGEEKLPGVIGAGVSRSK